MIGHAMEEAAAALRAAERVLLACHINPDGDTLGSALALGLALSREGKHVVLLSPDGVPAPYHFMPGADRFVQTPPDEPFDAAVALDCDGEPRLGPAAAGVRRGTRVVDIDHHTGAERFGDIVVVDSSAAATGELVFRLLRILAVPITPEIATNLYVAILTDTGSFRFANTTGRVLRIASELVDCGANPSRIAQQVYECRSFSSVAVLGRALVSVKRSEGGQIAWARLSASDFKRAGATDSETEGIVNHLRAIAGVRVAVLFRQVNGRVRVSLRSRAPVDVVAVARTFGGGGHRLAAGCTIAAPLTEAERLVLAETRKALLHSPEPPIPHEPDPDAESGTPNPEPQSYGRHSEHPQTRRPDLA